MFVFLEELKARQIVSEIFRHLIVCISDVKLWLTDRVIKLQETISLYFLLTQEEKKNEKSMKTSKRPTENLTRDKYLYEQYISTYKLYLNNTEEENILHT